MTGVACPYDSVCSGCDWLHEPYARQRALKLESLASHWRSATGQGLPRTEFISIAESGLRDRVDLVYDAREGAPRLGLFDKAHEHIVDLEKCPQLSPPLEAWLKEFRSFRFPIARGSVRLRVGRSGQKGVWLDFANLDVKALLDERELLHSLSSVAIVEIGQKRKRLIEREGALKLADPVLDAWFETRLEGDDRPVPLYCTVGSFTQPGLAANRALVGEVLGAIRAAKPRRAFEFGAGIGNFTLPLASACESVEVFEIDALALEGLARSLAETGLDGRVQIHRGNFHAAREGVVDFSKADLVLVDPPRSGLQDFLTPLETAGPSSRPRDFIYVSCFAESFSADAKRLLALGYRALSLAIVDQFPQSRHYEIVARFSLR